MMTETKPTEARELTLTDLRRECKAIGVTVTKKTYSWGPHITFKINGCDVGSVLSREFYEKHQEKFEKLQIIREQFTGLQVDGQKTYGITPTS